MEMMQIPTHFLTLAAELGAANIYLSRLEEQSDESMDFHVIVKGFGSSRVDKADALQSLKQFKATMAYLIQVRDTA